MRNERTKKLVIAAMLIAVGVIGGAWSIPVGASKCAPVQHMINILSATVLGPSYGIIIAFIVSILRNIMGTGSLLAFPGSMFGAFLSGILFKAFKKGFNSGLLGAVAGELVGTAVLGGMCAYPIAMIFMNNSAAALFTYVVPFLISSLGGTVIGTILYLTLKKTKALNKMGL